MDALFKCPKCGATEKLGVPEKECLAFYRCKDCCGLIRPAGNDCCVICSYSDKKCPVHKG